jgi:fatty-acid peroxygenase
MFLSVTTPAPSIADLVDRTVRAWDAAATRWSADPEIRLFDEAARVLMRGVSDWAGVPLPDRDLPARARDMVAMVDGFGSAGGRHVRALLARRRSEQWAAAVVAGARNRTDQLAPPLRAVSEHRDPDGTLLPAHVAGIELLNLLRPTVAVSWYVAFAVHALDADPVLARTLAEADDEYAEAFVHELRRYYPFAPAVGARARGDVSFGGEQVPPGSLVLADVYGQHHDPALWDEPDRFRPERFLDRDLGEFELVPQGGGDPATGHRCAGERITIELLKALCRRLGALEYELPPQRLDYSLRRIPTRPRSGCVLRRVRVPDRERSA